MKIKSFHILQYGPLSDTGKIELTNFSLIFGENEIGKTLLVDALIKKLFKNKSTKRYFLDIDRVADTPAGSIEIIDAAGKPIENISSAMGNIDLLDARNIFIVRNSDLNFEKEDDYYHTLTDRLTGINLKKIERVEMKLRIKTSLTPAGNFLNKIKDILSKISAKKQEINDVITDFRQKNLPELENTIIQLEKNKNVSEKSLELFANSEKKLRYSQISGSLKKIKYCEQSLKSFPNLSSQERDDILEKQTARRNKTRELNDKHRELNGIEKYIIDRKEQLAIIETDFSKIRQKKDFFEKNRYKLDEINSCITKYAGNTVLYRIGIPIYIGLIFLIITALLGIKFRFSPPLLVATVIEVLAIGWRIYYKLQQAGVSADISGLLNNAALNEIKASDIPDLFVQAKIVSQKFDKLKERQGNLKYEISSETGKRETIEKYIVSLRNEIDKINDFFETLEKEKGISDYETYETKLKKYIEIESEIKTEKNTLRAKFGTDKYADLESILKELEKYKDFEIEKEFNRDSIQNARETLKNLNMQINKSSKEIDGYKYRIKAFASDNMLLKTASENLSPLFYNENELILDEISTLNDLENMYSKFSEMEENFEEQKAIAINSLSILDEIRIEQELNIESLFEKSNAEKYFKKVTDGKYTSVKYKRDDKKIVATDISGGEHPTKQLSGGTIDQLYFAIRIALGERMLSESGFFILDDPFLKYDSHRLVNQMKILQKLVKSGWQIIYFSAKSEVKDAFNQIGGQVITLKS